MRKNQIVKIDNKEITVKELRVKDIMELFQSVNGGDTSMLAFLQKGSVLTEKCLSGITFDELQELAPSELKELYDTFQAVNDTFFDLLRSLGIMDLLGNLKTQFSNDLLKASALSSKKVTDNVLGTTATTSLPAPSEQ